MELSKLEAATIQLDRAIQLFMEKDWLCSLTLAGAAEEILGKLAKRAGNEVAVEFISKYHANDDEGGYFAGKSERDIVSELNVVRNSAKHANDPAEVKVAVGLTDALQMLMRAMPMAVGLGVQTENMNRMHAWIKANSEETHA